MTQTLDTPVLIAGAGPTGLVLASLLSRHGISCVLAERNTHTTKFPKMDITNGASMELLRRLGVDDELRRLGVASQHSFDVIFAPGLDGPEITRWRLPSVDEEWATLRGSPDGTRPGQPWQRCSQAIFEAVMMDRCRRDPLIDVRQGWQLQSCAQNGDAVEATLVDDTGDVLKIRASYGVTGNDGIGDFAYVTTVDPGGQRNYSFGTGDNVYLGFSPSGPARADLKWEETRQTDIGFDAYLLNSLSLTVDVYKKKTVGILQNP